MSVFLKKSIMLNRVHLSNKTAQVFLKVLAISLIASHTWLCVIAILPNVLLFIRSSMLFCCKHGNGIAVVDGNNAMLVYTQAFLIYTLRTV